MLRKAPKDFSIKRFYEGVYTFQQWEVFPGHSTKGNKPVVSWMDKMGIPSDLTGKRILDIAPWNGFFGFECARRGASQVISFGPDNPNDTGYTRTKELLRIDNCNWVTGSVYDLDPGKIGTFDIVFFLGLFYHLRHPLLALDKIYDVCKDELYMDTPIIDFAVFDKTISQKSKEIILATPEVHHLPMMYFSATNETGDPFNWFMPNRKAITASLIASGFKLVSEGFEPNHWAWAKAKKSIRQFTPGLEGYSAIASSQIGNN